jgi:hypothetical protein
MKNTDKLFRAELKERLGNYSAEPDTRLWQNITAATKSTRRKTIPFWKKTGVVSLAVLGLLSGWVVYNDQKSDAVSAQDAKGKIIQQEQKTVDNFSSVPKEVNASGTKPSSNETSVPQARSHISPETKTVRESTTVNELSGNSFRLTTDETSGIVNETPERDGVSSYKISTLDTATSTEITSIDQKSIANEEVVEKTSANKKKESRPYNLYFTAMPTLGYQRVESNSKDKFIIESIDKLATFSSERLGLRAELGIELPVKKRINFFAGVLYYQRKQTIGYTEKQVSGTDVHVDPDGNIVVLTEYDYVHKTFEHQLKNIGVQVGFNYTLSKTKFLQTVGTGIEFHYALNKLVQDTPVVTNNPTAYVFYNLYYRLQYPSDGRLKAVAQPTLNYSFYIDENFNAPFYVKPYGLGFNIGATYNF